MHAYWTIRGIRAALSAVALITSAALAVGAARAGNDGDVLYVGDAGDPTNVGDDTIKRIDARTGAFLGVLVKPVPLIGPMGLIVRESLYVANQNTFQPFAGDILRYSVVNGRLLQRVVDHEKPDAHAPFAPRGMVLWDKNLFVANFVDNDNGDPGQVLKYTIAGEFLQRLIPDNLSFDFHPRGMVIGPDRRLYVSNFPDLATGRGGQVLRFDPASGAFLDVFVANDPRSPASGCTGNLNRPEGLVFGPDGNLYITSFRADASDVDRILIFAGPGSRRPAVCLGSIELDRVGKPRSSAQALLFGPRGDLFVPITNASGPPVKKSGAIRRYRLKDLRFGPRPPFTNFVAPHANGGPLVQPWYLTFDETDPGTLAYRDD